MLMAVLASVAALFIGASPYQVGAGCLFISVGPGVVICWVVSCYPKLGCMHCAGPGVVTFYPM